MKKLFPQNNSAKNIIINMITAFIALFVNGFGVYLTIHANIGVSPWDVLTMGISKTAGILFGNASILVSFIVLAVDIIMKEPIGLAMLIDAITVGKAIDFFNYIAVVPEPKNLFASIVMMVIGLFILAYTQYFYMNVSLGCGPRDTLLVGLKRKISKVPIGIVSICLLSVVTFSGWLLGGQVGIGTLICAFLAGPIMQLVFELVHFDVTRIRHQRISQSFRVFAAARKKQQK